MKRTIELEDTLQELIDGAMEDIGELLEQYLAENPDTDELPELSGKLRLRRTGPPDH